MFDDPHAVDEADDEPDEDRWQRTGLTRGGRLLFVVHADRPTSHSHHLGSRGRPARARSPRPANASLRTMAGTTTTARSPPAAGPIPTDDRRREARGGACRSRLPTLDARATGPPASTRRARQVHPAAHGLSQAEFAQRFGIPLETLGDWERHRSEPDATVLALLRTIEREPEAVARALAPEAAQAREETRAGPSRCPETFPPLLWMCCQARRTCVPLRPAPM